MFLHPEHAGPMSAVHLQHSDLHPNDCLCTPPPISSLIVQETWVSLLDLIFPLCLLLLLTKNSLAGPCNYILITLGEDTTDILLLLLVRLSPPT